MRSRVVLHRTDQHTLTTFTRSLHLDTFWDPPAAVQIHGRIAFRRVHGLPQRWAPSTTRRSMTPQSQPESTITDMHRHNGRREEGAKQSKHGKKTRSDEMGYHCGTPSARVSVRRVLWWGKGRGFGGKGRPARKQKKKKAKTLLASTRSVPPSPLTRRGDGWGATTGCLWATEKGGGGCVRRNKRAARAQIGERNSGRISPQANRPVRGCHRWCCSLSKGCSRHCARTGGGRRPAAAAGVKARRSESPRKDQVTQN